jgi:hypothetical protein
MEDAFTLTGGVMAIYLASVPVPLSGWPLYLIMAIGLGGGAYFAIAMALAIGGVGRSYIKIRMNEALREDRQQLNTAMLELWQRLNWWRYLPPEGWQVGYNVGRIPMACHLHVQRYGRIMPPTMDEITADIQQWTYLGGLRVRLPGGQVYRLN